MKNENIVTCYDEINRFLGDFPYEKNNGDAIFIHESIIELVSDRLLSHGYTLTRETAWNYDLNIGQKCYKMFLIWIDLAELMSSKLHMIVSESKYSCPWHPNTTIYTTLDKFYLVEQFIKENNLERFLPTIGIEANRLCVDAVIKYAEFTRKVTITDFLPKFRTFLEMNDYKLPNTYFACRAFKYLRRSYLVDHNKPFHRYQDTITQALLENGDFNIFDLIAMKMAIDDNRLDYINCAFHKLIDRKLQELSTDENNVYLKARHFNLNKYHGDMGILGYSEEVYQYFVTNFYSYFDTIKVFRNYGTFKVKPKLISNITELLNRPLYCNKLHVGFKTLNEHNSGILMEIMQNDNSHFLRTLTFDTEKPLENKIVEIDNYCESILPSRDLHFTGLNSGHFVENLLNWMRFTMGSRWDDCDLRFINTQIVGVSVLRGLTVRMIILKEMRITCKLLRALHHVKYETIKLSKCDLENDPAIFMLLDSLGGDRYIQINIEDHTLEILMDSIKMVLTTTGRKEFQFQNYVTVYYLASKFEFIDLSRFKFFINEDGTKIETCDLYTNQTVNLFDYFYKPEAANYRNKLEFYN